MSNRSYNPTGKPTFNAFGSSKDISNEFAAVGVGCAELEGELNGKVATSQVTQTVGNPGSSSNIPSEAAVRSAILNAVAGGNVGNSSGQIPISNGTKCTNLNADMVDGFHASQSGAASSLVATNSFGRVLLGTTDNGVDLVQISGSVAMANNPIKWTGYGNALAMVTGNCAGRINHFYDGATGDDYLSYSINYNRTSSTAGSIDSTTSFSAEMLLHTNAGASGTGVEFKFSTAVNTAPVTVTSIDNVGNITANGGVSAGGPLSCVISTSAPTLATNQQMSFQLVSNTSLKILVRGTDGVARSTTLTLA